MEWKASGAWQPAALCQDLLARNETECKLTGLTLMDSYMDPRPEVQALKSNILQDPAKIAVG